jgi:hypothetical protein
MRRRQADGIVRISGAPGTALLLAAGKVLAQRSRGPFAPGLGLPFGLAHPCRARCRRRRTRRSRCHLVPALQAPVLILCHAVFLQERVFEKKSPRRSIVISLRKQENIRFSLALPANLWQ